MQRTIGRLAAAAVALAATMTVFARAASAQSSRGERAGSTSNSRGFDKISDARELTTGLSLGVYTLAAGGVTITGPGIAGAWSTGNGEGAGLMVGYGFNHSFTGYASLDVAKQSSTNDSYPSGEFGLANFEIGARANIPFKSARTVPYVSASVGNRVVAGTAINGYGDSGDISMSGRAFVLGGGVEHFFSPHMSLDAGVEYATGTFDRYHNPDGDITENNNSTSTVRLRVGVNWRP